MNSLKNLPDSKKQELLNAAAQKLGISPEELKKQLESGTFDKALCNMPRNDAAMLVKALSDQNTAEKILSSPQAKAIYQKLCGPK